MPSDFLSRLNAADRERLERIGKAIRLEPRQHLLVRGEQGGDVFRVERGQLEIVDRRSRPEVILDVLGPGELVGELGFIDGTPRSADAFAGPGCVVTLWPAEDLEVLLSSDDAFAARFWRAMAEEVGDRLREVTSNAVTGGLRGAAPVGAGTDGTATMMARSLVQTCLAGLAQVDSALRRNPDDSELVGGVGDLLDMLQVEVGRAQRQGGEPAVVARALRKVGRQVHPYLLRSTTAELCLARPEGLAGGPAVLRHLLAGRAGGDGPLGKAVDRWLLDQPRVQGMRHRLELLGQRLEAQLATQLGPLRIVMINTAQGPILQRTWQRVSGLEGELWIVEPTRRALTALDTMLAGSHARMRYRLLQEQLGGPAPAKALRNLESVDFIVADSLVEYLPARVAAEVLRQLRSLLAPRGRLLLTALAPTPDDILWTQLLNWPAITRTVASMEAILAAAGYADITVTRGEGAGMLVLAAQAQRT